MSIHGPRAGSPKPGRSGRGQARTAAFEPRFCAPSRPAADQFLGEAWVVSATARDAMSILASRAVAETTQASPRNWSTAGREPAHNRGSKAAVRADPPPSARGVDDPLG